MLDGARYCPPVGCFIKGKATSTHPQSIKSHPDGKKPPNASLSHSTHLHSPSNPNLMGRKHLRPTQLTYTIATRRHSQPILIRTRKSVTLTPHFLSNCTSLFRDEFKRQTLGSKYPGYLYSDFPQSLSSIPYFFPFSESQTESNDSGPHLVVCVHGLDGEDCSAIGRSICHWNVATPPFFTQRPYKRFSASLILQETKLICVL